MYDAVKSVVWEFLQYAMITSRLVEGDRNHSSYFEQNFLLLVFIDN